MKSLINTGEPVPHFKGADQYNNEISNHTLLGKPYILYFYPKDDTPGCTTEACEFRDEQPQFEKLDISVIGISPDSEASHKNFASKHNLNFSLLPDENHQLCETFEVWGEKTIFGLKKMGVTRTTLLVNKEGIICWIEKPVKVEGHVQRVLEAIKQLGDS